MFFCGKIRKFNLPSIIFLFSQQKLCCENKLGKAILMRSNNIMFYAEIQKLSLNYPFYAFLSGSLIPNHACPWAYFSRYGKCYLRYMSAPPCFSTIFSKGNIFSDFLFATLDREILPKRDPSLKEKTYSYIKCSKEKVAKTKMLSFHECVSIHI